MVRRDDILDAEILTALAPGSEVGGAGQPQERLLGAIEALRDGRLDALDGMTPEERALVEAVAEGIAEWETEQGDGASSRRPKVLEMVYRISGRALAFLSGSVVPEPVLAPVAVRASRTSAQPLGYSEFVAHLQGASCRVSVETLAAGLLQVQIELLSPSSRGVRASLLRESKLLESAPFEDGRVLFTGLKPQTFLLELSGPTGDLGSFRLRFLDQ